jgi:hypothetical protein
MPCPIPAQPSRPIFVWVPIPPVVEAYKAWKPMLHDAHSQDVAAALYATRPKRGFAETLRTKPRIEVLDDRRTKDEVYARGLGHEKSGGSSRYGRSRSALRFTRLASRRNVASMRSFRLNNGNAAISSG